MSFMTNKENRLRDAAMIAVIALTLYMAISGPLIATVHRHAGIFSVPPISVILCHATYSPLECTDTTRRMLESYVKWCESLL